MSDSRLMLDDLLKCDCFANDRRFEMRFSGARNVDIRGGVGETSDDDAAEVSRDREVGRNFSATGVIDQHQALIGGPGWGAKIMILRPVNVCGAMGVMISGRPRRSATTTAMHISPPAARRPAPVRHCDENKHDRAHHDAESCGTAPSYPVPIFIRHREWFFPHGFLPCESRGQVRASICAAFQRGHKQSSSPMLFNPEHPA
jgi:hypothetical protein